jgi:hypothetical protein
VTIKLAEALGGAWIEQFILTAVIFAVLNLVFKVVDVCFVLLLKDAFATVEVEQLSLKALKHLFTSIRGGVNERSGKGGGGGGGGGGGDDRGGGCLGKRFKRSTAGEKQNSGAATAAPATATAADGDVNGYMADRLERGSGVESATHRAQQHAHAREQESLRQQDWLREKKDWLRGRKLDSKQSMRAAAADDDAVLEMQSGKSAARVQATCSIKKDAQVLLIAKKLVKAGPCTTS